jgi:RNA polymerase primary sigma factor
MPALSKARIPCIARLARELGFASKPTLLRHLDHIDELGPQIDPDLVYPEDWVVFRVTGYRPNIDTPEIVPGEALRGDLSALAESISEAAGLTPEDVRGPVLKIDDLCARWTVSRKTIERYRRLGLIARRLDLGMGRRSVVFLLSAVEWFETIHADRLGRAARFDRIPQREREMIARWARGYQLRLGYSRSQAAQRIAQRTGHSHEGVRQLLLRIDERSEKPIFHEPGPVGDREGLLALRAMTRGIEPKSIAAHLNRRVSAIGRATRLTRARFLRDLSLPQEAVNQHDLRETLESEPMLQIERITAETDLAQMIDQIRVRTPSVAYEEQVRSRAVYLLRRHCGHRIAQINDRAPSAALLDEIETDLRLITMLKAGLLNTQLPLVLSSIESRLGGPINTLAPARAAQLMHGGIGVASGALDRYDPTHGGRIAAPIGLAVNRYAAAQPDVAQPVGEGRAARRIASGIAIPDWTRSLSPWQRWLDPDPRLRLVLHKLEERDRVVLVLRFAMGESRPITRASLAGLLGTQPIHAARYERAAIRNANFLVRTTENVE